MAAIIPAAVAGVAALEPAGWPDCQVGHRPGLVVIAHKAVSNANTVGIEFTKDVTGICLAARRISSIVTQRHRALVILAPVQQGSKTAQRCLPIQPALVAQCVNNQWHT